MRLRQFMLSSGLLVATLFGASIASAAVEDDQRAVAALDTEYQRAVEQNDAETMARILHESFTLVVGDGRTFSRADLLESARRRTAEYEHQVEDEGTQIVRVLGDTAVVTARLWLKGASAGKPFERRLWFSDTYVRTPEGWRYFFGQASLPLPSDDAAR